MCLVVRDGVLSVVDSVVVAHDLAAVPNGDVGSAKNKQAMAAELL
ncbi:hypothetical protein [Stenotrophomonas sp. SAU14A_NAIMI4_5]|nr:hypothetical protein [Stenotrophomonas sp. SAU14A_NAIMI4_5]